MDIPDLTGRRKIPPHALGAAAVALLLLPVFFDGIGLSYAILICCMIMFYIVAVSGLDIVFGYSGQISLGHGAFYALGAYGSAILHNYAGVPVFFSMFIATIVAAAIGALLAWPASKLVFHFLSLSTVAFSEIIYQAITHSPYKVTGDFVGMRSEYLEIFGLRLDSSFSYYYFALGMTALFLLAKRWLIDSKVGRAFIAIRENTHAADGMGIDVRKYKIIAFTISAFFTAYAGSMYMHLVRYASPDLAMPRQSVLFLTMLLFGGTGSLMGPIIGVMSVTILTELLRSWQDYMMLIYGVLMLIVIVGLPGGLWGAFEDIYGFIKRGGKPVVTSESIRRAMEDSDAS